MPVPTEMPTVNATARQIPSELVHKILISVLADSVHAICMSPLSTKDLQWHYNVLSTLCRVCFSFQEIAKDLAVKALAIKGERECIPRLVYDKLQYLRTLGIRFRSPFGQTPQSFGPTDGSHLVQAYSLYLTATALRRNAIETRDCGEVFQTAHELVLKALGMSLRLCDLVQPKGLEDVLRRAVRNEIVLVEISTSIVRARIDLDNTLDKMMAATKVSDTPNAQQIDSIKAELHVSLQKIEEADEKSGKIMSTEATFMPDLKHPILQFPGVLLAVKVCSKFKFDLDEYDIGGRASGLVARWEELRVKERDRVGDDCDDSFNLASTLTPGRSRRNSL